MCSTRLRDSRLQHRRSAKDRPKTRRAASDYSSSLLTINRLEAALTCTQSYDIVLRNDRVDVYAPRAMRRCARLIDEICHDQKRRGFRRRRRRRAAPRLQAGRKGRCGSAVFGICLASEIKLYGKREMRWSTIRTKATQR